MGRLRITIQSNGLAAVAQVAPGEPLSSEAILALLGQSGVVHGIDHAAVAALAQDLEDSAFQGIATLARGEAATAGVDGRIDGEDHQGLVPGQTKADGSIDFRERHLLHPVAEGQLVGTVVPPTPGLAGRDVRGRELPARPGQPHRLRLGPGVRQQELQVLAARGGVVLADPRQLDVVDLYVHGANVDYRSGSLHTEGSLAVRGDVCEGFSAVATGDLHVTGAALDATVTAGGSIQIDQGVLGVGCSVRAGGDIACRHATSAQLQAGGTIQLGDQAAHSRLRANRLLARRGRGSVFGGEVRARQLIAVMDAGTAAGSPTRLVIGDLTEQATELVRRTNTDTKIEARATQRGRVTDPRQGGGKARRQAMRLSDQVLPEQLRLRQQQRELLRTACIEVHGQLHAGVTLQFGELTMLVRAPKSQVRLRLHDTDHTIVEEPIR